MKRNELIDEGDLDESVTCILQIKEYGTNTVFLIEVLCNVFIDREKLEGGGMVFTEPKVRITDQTVGITKVRKPVIYHGFKQFTHTGEQGNRVMVPWAFHRFTRFKDAGNVS